MYAFVVYKYKSTPLLVIEYDVMFAINVATFAAVAEPVDNALVEGSAVSPLNNR